MNNEKILELIAAHGLEGYGLYMYLSNISDENIFYDEWFSEVVGLSHIRIAEIIITCIELDLLDLKNMDRG